MSKKFIIREAWLLDDNGDRLMKLTPEQDPNEVFEYHIVQEDIRGGYGSLDKTEAREKIEAYILQCGYTYTVETLMASYLEYYKKGYYVSFTTKDCIKNLENEFEILANSQ